MLPQQSSKTKHTLLRSSPRAMLSLRPAGMKAVQPWLGYLSHQPWSSESPRKAVYDEATRGKRNDTNDVGCIRSSTSTIDNPDRIGSKAPTLKIHSS